MRVQGWPRSLDLAPRTPTRRTRADPAEEHGRRWCRSRPEDPHRSRAADDALTLRDEHEVDEPKAARFMIPWVELEAEAVLVDPLVWRPRQEGERAVNDARSRGLRAMTSLSGRTHFPFFQTPRSVRLCRLVLVEELPATESA